MKEKEIRGIKEIFRLEHIKELIEDEFVKGQIDRVISYVEGTFSHEENFEFTESGKILFERRLILLFNKVFPEKAEHKSSVKLIVFRGKINPYFHEDGSLTSYHKESIKKEFEEKKEPLGSKVKTFEERYKYKQPVCA